MHSNRIDLGVTSRRLFEGGRGAVGAWDDATQVNQRPTHVYLLENTSLGTLLYLENPPPPAILSPLGTEREQVRAHTRTSKDSLIQCESRGQRRVMTVLFCSEGHLLVPRSPWLNVSLPNPVLTSQTPSRVHGRLSAPLMGRLGTSSDRETPRVRQRASAYIAGRECVEFQWIKRVSVTNCVQACIL